MALMMRDDLGGWNGWAGGLEGGREGGFPALLREVPYILYVSLHEQKQELVFTQPSGFS